MNIRIPRRTFLRTAAAAGMASAWPAGHLLAASASNTVNLGFIGCGSRGKALAGFFSEIEGVNIAGLCDPDEERLGQLHEQFPAAKTCQDLRRLIDDADIDAVVIAACNHWHCLAAIWAMQAGKDVYVEKPLSNTLWEGRQTVAAAKKYNCICQVGTHQRSDPLQAEIKKVLHQDRELGKILSVRANRFGVREPIGKRSQPMTIPPQVDYDLWLGPAADQPILRNELHYDWHWDWNTGAGEMGNWGVHILDDVRNTVFMDSVPFPQRMIAGGGRVAWNDAGDTPNVQFAYFDTGSIPVVFGLSNLPAKPGVEEAAPHVGPSSGYVVYCEGGVLHGQREKFTVYDHDGNQIKQMKTEGGNHHHQRNFIDAVRQQDSTLLKSTIDQGHYTSSWCNLANVAVRLGSAFVTKDSDRVDSQDWRDVLQSTAALLAAYDIEMDKSPVQISPLLEFDSQSEQFVGEGSAAANKWLQRAARPGFELPQVVS